MGLKRHIIIHAGLHKTGSTSIQACFSQLDMPDHDYLNWGNRNHSVFFHQAFKPQELYDSTHPNSKLPSEEFERHTQHFRRCLIQGIEAATKKNLIISAEGLSALKMEDNLVEFRDLILPYASKITVIAYVRPIESMLASAMQQNIKSGRVVKFPPKTALPGRILHLIDTFGQEDVILRKYHKPELLEGNVVRDFANLIGVDVSPENSRYENAASSLETIAVMYLHNLCFKDDPKHLKNTRIQTSVARVLKDFGSERFRLGPKVILKMKRKIVKPMTKIENMMGVSLQGEPVADSGISNLKELERIAVNQASSLESYISQLYLTSETDRAILDEGIAVAKSQENKARYVAYLIEAIKMVEMMRIINPPELSALFMQKSNPHIRQRSFVSYDRIMANMAGIMDRIFARKQVVTK